uniref:ribosomal protein S11 n=1 Tax=Halophila ovalis TaxID=62339 RepID=UPI00226C9B29|nr:ribosomal protein S11 [Halophila ovalis]YP_010574418.1 ribosomal protein S11 [Halophila ovalis]UZH94392.1 ribosomal protein S11 [Halophila ovalis]UZH94429.1 ribosomal protein S11 [Halophila ovalis]
MTKPKLKQTKPKRLRQTKPNPQKLRVSINKRIALSKKRHIRLRKKGRTISKGVIHVQANFNNTIVTVTDARGQVISWSSAGALGFTGPRKGTPFAAQTVARDAISVVGGGILKQADVKIKGGGSGRDAALLAISKSKIVLDFVRDVTPLPHNGCRPPKKRRV